MERQTGFTLKELIQMVESGEYTTCPGSGSVGLLPLGVLLNEIGTIFLETGDSSAEDLLANMLASDHIGTKFICYGFLFANSANLSDEAKLLVHGFEENPANAELVQNARETVANL
ncbi:MAG: hypothetical protein ACKKL6_03815 [Candidatus Komeilibacteria bacterium]